MTPFALDLDLRSPGAVVLRLTDAGGPLGRSRQFVVRPQPRVLKVLQLGPVSEPLTRALRAVAKVELFAADALPADTAAFDLVVVNGIEVAHMPATNVLWLGAGHAAGEAGAAARVPPQTGGWQADHLAVRFGRLGGDPDRPCLRVFAAARRHVPSWRRAALPWWRRGPR